MDSKDLILTDKMNDLRQTIKDQQLYITYLEGLVDDMALEVEWEDIADLIFAEPIEGVNVGKPLNVE